jgi:L-ascorbate metabolism protein UlaG (beta-lactamase superfamily)
MDAQFYGGNCIVLSTKQARVVIDDNLVDLGKKSVTKSGDISIFTGAHGGTAADVKITIGQPGEYEVSGVVIQGIAARGHMEEDGNSGETMYKISFDDLRILITGHIYPELTDKQLEAIGTVDIMFVPVGGNGYTLDGVGALKLIKKLEPKLVIPTHYASETLSFPVPQRSLEEVLQALAMEPKETVTKLKLKASELAEDTQVTILEEV